MTIWQRRLSEENVPNPEYEKHHARLAKPKSLGNKKRELASMCRMKRIEDSGIRTDPEKRRFNKDSQDETGY